MKIRKVPSTWLEHNGRRLDCGPYMSGAIEARELLSRLPTSPLRDLTAGIDGGIYNGPQFVRHYVTDPEHGVPFLTTSSMLHWDLSGLSLLSKVDAHSSNLRHLRIEEGMALITCSGNVGRMAYARKALAGAWSNQDIMKVVANPERVLPGYLYAYLAGRFGVPLIASGTYGAVIQHIEPQHISDLPVPRLGNVEGIAHDLVQQAGDELSESSTLLVEATRAMLEQAGLVESQNHRYLEDNRRLGWIESHFDAFSLRALNYDPRAKDLWDAIAGIRQDRLGDVTDQSSFQGHIVFKRIDADPEYSVMLVGQREAFQLRPDGRWISRKSVEGLGLQVPAGTTVIPCHGTFGESELYCRAALVTERTSRYAYSGDFYRCIPKDGAIASGYLHAFLRSRLAFRIMRSMSTGSKQQYQHPVLMANMPIPRLNAKREQEIAAMVDRASILRDHALDLEDEACAVVERVIEGGDCQWQRS